MMQQKMSNIFHDSLMQHLLEHGQVFLADLVDYDNEDKSLEEILPQEAYDSDKLFGPTHDITISSKLGLAVRACHRLTSKGMMKAVGVLSSMLDQLSEGSVLMTLRCLSYMAILFCDKASGMMQNVYLSLSMRP